MGDEGDGPQGPKSPAGAGAGEKLGGIMTFSYYKGALKRAKLEEQDFWWETPTGEVQGKIIYVEEVCPCEAEEWIRKNVEKMLFFHGVWKRGSKEVSVMVLVPQKKEWAGESVFEFYFITPSRNK